MKRDEEIQLLADVKIIKEKVEDLKPAVDKNTKFRYYVIGFLIISIASLGVALNLVRLQKAIEPTKIVRMYK